MDLRNNVFKSERQMCASINEARAYGYNAYVVINGETYTLDFDVASPKAREIAQDYILDHLWSVATYEIGNGYYIELSLSLDYREGICVDLYKDGDEDPVEMLTENRETLADGVQFMIDVAEGRE